MRIAILYSARSTSSAKMVIRPQQKNILFLVVCAGLYFEKRGNFLVHNRNNLLHSTRCNQECACGRKKLGMQSFTPGFGNFPRTVVALCLHYLQNITFINCSRTVIKVPSCQHERGSYIVDPVCRVLATSSVFWCGNIPPVQLLQVSFIFATEESKVHSFPGVQKCFGILIIYDNFKPTLHSLLAKYKICLGYL